MGDLIDMARRLRRGDVEPTQLVQQAIERIGDDPCGAFAHVDRRGALDRASALGTPPSDAPPLWGIPLADKDLTARAGMPTSYGSRAFVSFVPEHSDPFALALDRLGSVGIGKTSTPEFGLTGYTENLVGPPARNPWQLATGAGGSSGGAAVAVSTGVLAAAPASDGGGSIRIPAATVGVVGLKPSRGRLPFSNGLDSPGGLSVAGAITRSIDDAAYFLDALVGSAQHVHATRAPRHGPFLDAVRREPASLRIGVTTTSPWDGWTDTTLDPSARRAYESAGAFLSVAGHEVEELVWDPRGYPDMFTTIWRASAARIPIPTEDLDRLAEPLTAWLVREGRALSAERVLAALQAAVTFERETIAAFASYDAVVTPALAMAPQPLGWFTETGDPEENFARQCRYAPHTSFVNVAGLPAITVPVTSVSGERPLSVQVIGRPGGESTILAVAAQLEAERGALPFPPAP
ncbi:amidase [Microbacterium amylolyticum]|uniref:Amidase n=1 Tax=Microbacterium amylolyticum TaxID=936337 RepID=A0ABS4ZG49_9MICO|nr:amidase [Microbacterium amylolyticum]MBP2436251.1 amidase [Microbacterium amylolyticum]